MLITKVKVGNVTNLSEARYCAGMGVDFLSFPITSIDPKTYQEITGWVVGPEFGIEVDANSSSLGEYKASFLEVKARQLAYFSGSPNLIVTLPASAWREARPDLLQSKKNIRYVELEVSGLDDATEKWVREAALDFELLIKPLEKVDIGKIKSLPVAGISLEGDSETKPGLKEYPLAGILEQLESD